MPGLNYANWSATLIPLAGFVFRVIDPAKYAGEGHIAQKETQQKSRAGTRVILKQRRGHCQLDSEVTVPVRVRECQGEFWENCPKEKGRELKTATRRRTYSLKGYFISPLPALNNRLYTTSRAFSILTDKKSHAFGTGIRSQKGFQAPGGGTPQNTGYVKEEIFFLLTFAKKCAAPLQIYSLHLPFLQKRGIT